MMKKIIVGLLLAVPLLGMAQTKENYSSWNSLIVNYQLNDNLYLKNETHFRRTNFLSDWQQILIRPGVHYKLNKTVTLSAGYTYSRNYKPNKKFNENDAWEQLMLSHKSGKSSFKHRFRLEQRFIDNIVQVPNGDFVKDGTNFGMRFRYRFTWSMPLIRVKNDKSIGITAFDEIWLNTEKGIVPRSVNQNWFYAGLSYPLSKKTSIGIGYLDAYAPIGGGHNFVDNHILQTTLKYHI